MKNTIKQILNRIIESDPALRGFGAEKLPAAARARVQNTLVSLEKILTHEELLEVEKWTGGNAIFDQAVTSLSEGECTYYVFSDGSLYFRSSADSEVWAFASDFAEHLINGYDGQLDQMDTSLLVFLGGIYAEEIRVRAGREN